MIAVPFHMTNFIHCVFGGLFVSHSIEFMQFICVLDCAYHGFLLLSRSMQFKASKFNYSKSILLSVCEKKVFHLLEMDIMLLFRHAEKTVLFNWTFTSKITHFD